MNEKVETQALPREEVSRSTDNAEQRMTEIQECLLILGFCPALELFSVTAKIVFTNIVNNMKS